MNFFPDKADRKRSVSDTKPAEELVKKSLSTLKKAGKMGATGEHICRISSSIYLKRNNSEEVERGKGRPRIQRANRQQIEMRVAALDSLVPGDHKVRIVWEMAQEYDLSRLYGYIDAVEGEAGRPAIDPLILVALWLYATTEGVGSARELARLCEEHIAYQWILGGVSVNYHTLADFRVNYESEMDEILTENVAALMSAGIVSLDRTAQDGIRVRASAGSKSFRRQAKLETFLVEAEKEVKLLKEMGHRDGEGLDQRRVSAQKRASEQRMERVKNALEEVKKIKAAKARSHRSRAKQREPRSSTTDPEARIMIMPDGGFRAAYNGQISVDVGSGIIVGVDVVKSRRPWANDTHVGSDRSTLSAYS